MGQSRRSGVRCRFPDTQKQMRTNKQGKATITMTFDIHGVEELNRLTDKLRQIEGVIDIERTAG